MRDGRATAKDAVPIRLPPRVGLPVQDKETPGARLTLRDRGWEKQPPVRMRGVGAGDGDGGGGGWRRGWVLRCPLLPPSGTVCGWDPDDKFGQTAERLLKEAVMLED